MQLSTQNSLYHWRLQIEMDPSLFVHLAIQFLDSIHQKHQIQGAIGNLHPTQIYISSNGSILNWSSYAGERQLPYMAPEQKGILNRKPDIRSDLYVVGLILYELFTGIRTYETNTDQEWGSNHLYEKAKATYEKETGIYERSIYFIICKLLNRSPDERYQTAYGVLYDLKQLEAAIKEGHEHINLGIGDTRQRFKLLGYLMKREDELFQLESYRQQLGSSADGHLYIVYGDDGVGKSTLLNQYQDLLEEQKLTVISLQCTDGGKEPYFFVKELQKRLIQKLLEQDNETFQACIASLESKQGEALAQLRHLSSGLWKMDCPEDEQLSTFDPDFCQQVVNIVCRFVKPAAIVIDQLEYIDEESYAFICKLAQNRLCGSMLIVAACRRSVCDERLLLNFHPHALELNSLTYSQIKEWVAYACQENSIRISQLSRIVYHSSQGNPAHIISLFNQWQQQKVFYYDEQKHDWQWNFGSMLNLSYADNILLVFKDNLSRLPRESVECLKFASVLGNQFSVKALAQTLELDVAYVKLQLQFAIREGIIAYLDEAEEDCMFLMNELQAHCYESMDAQRRAAIHLKIAENLEFNASELALYHMNHAIQLLTKNQLAELAQLNFNRGMHAYKGKKYKQATEDFKFTLHALNQPDLNIPELTHRTTLYLAMSLAYCNKIEESKQYFKQVEHDLNQLDDDDYLAACIHQLEFNSFHRNEMAVAAAKQGLMRFGLQAKSSSNLFNAFVQTALTINKIREYRRDLSNIKLCEDKAYYAQCKIMGSHFFALLIVNPVELLISYSKFIRCGLKKGINDSLVDLISSYEVLIQRVFTLGYPYWPKDMFKQLSLLLPSSNNESLHSMYAYSMVEQWKAPFETDIVLLNTIHAAMDKSDTMFVNFAALTFMVCNQGKISHLEELLRIFEGEKKYLFNISTMHYKKYAVDYYHAWMSEAGQHYFIQLHENGEPEEIDNFIAIQRAEQAYLAGEYEIGMKWIQCARAKELKPDWMRIRKLRIYETMLAVELYKTTSDPKPKARYKKIVLKCVNKMKGWKGAHGFQSSSYYLVKAEASRLNGHLEKALRDYDLAVKQAKSEEHWLLEGIAYERQADAYQAKGVDSGFIISLMDALTAYRKWGAQAKAEQLRRNYPQLMINRNLGESIEKADSTVEIKSISPKIEKNHSDSIMIEYAEQAWRWLEELEYKQDYSHALNKLLEMIQQQTGAERGLLLRLDQDYFDLLASTESLDPEISLQDTAALPILRYVDRTEETILLEEAATGQYRSIPYIKANEVKSVLCMPVKLQVESKPWVLYLDSRILSDVFSSHSVEMIQLMITRFAYLQYINQGQKTSDSLVVSESIEMTEPRKDNRVVVGVVETLTTRELEVLQLLYSGYSNKDIANQLFVSESTIKSHVSNIYGKLGVKRRTQAIRRAEELNLVK